MCQIMQMVRLIENGEEVKMSKRTGKAITLRDIIEMIGVENPATTRSIMHSMRMPASVRQCGCHYDD